MRQEISAIFGGKKVELHETPRAVTPFGGLVGFVEFLRKIDYAEQVRQRMPFQLKSPNAIDPVETFTAFLFSVVAGARRFAYTSLLGEFQRASGLSTYRQSATLRAHVFLCGAWPRRPPLGPAVVRVLG